MLIKYNSTTGNIIEVQSHETHILKAGTGETVEEYQGTLKPLSGMVRVGKDEVREKNKTEKDSETAAIKTDKQKRIEELSAKESLTNDEITEVLKLNGLLK